MNSSSLETGFLTPRQCDFKKQSMFPGALTSQRSPRLRYGGGAKEPQDRAREGKGGERKGRGEAGGADRSNVGVGDSPGGGFLFGGSNEY